MGENTNQVKHFKLKGYIYMDENFIFLQDTIDHYSDKDDYFLHAILQYLFNHYQKNRLLFLSSFFNFDWQKKKYMTIAYPPNV